MAGGRTPLSSLIRFTAEARRLIEEAVMAEYRRVVSEVESFHWSAAKLPGIPVA
jgi:hypothetical protein